MYESTLGIFKTHVRAQFLSPLVTYTVNLVFKFSQRDNTLSKVRFTSLVYKLKHERWIQSSLSYLAHERDDGWMMIELYQFTSDANTIDLTIHFEGWGYMNYGPILIEGIEFRPLAKVRFMTNSGLFVYNNLFFLFLRRQFHHKCTFYS